MKTLIKKRVIREIQHFKKLSENPSDFSITYNYADFNTSQ